MLNNRILMRVNTQFLCQLASHSGIRMVQTLIQGQCCCCGAPQHKVSRTQAVPGGHSLESAQICFPHVIAFVGEQMTVASVVT